MKKTQNDALYAVLFGGVGVESDISVMSAGNFIRTAIGAGYGILPIYIDKNGFFYIYRMGEDDLKTGFLPDASELIPVFPVKLPKGSGFMSDDGKITEVKLAVPILHGDFGEDGKIQGLLESAGIPFIGALTVCGAVCADKAYTKAVASDIGIPVLPSFVYSAGKEPISDYISKAEREIGYPVFVKPCRLGSSVGASIAENRDELEAALNSALSFAERILVERAVVKKRELECAYFSAGGTELITPPGEAVSKSKFYDYDAKYKSEDTRLFVEAELCEARKNILINYTERLAKALDVRHIARFDYFLSEDGQMYFNEVNTFPGMTSGSLYTAMLENSGISFSELIGALLETGGVS